ncbi:MAG: hypothetical protein ACD_58C00025G0001 [uncultured bacterium]|nr:MAG: hypothetical protein ACD_58C00025G0001 [uncultured bacterium]
MDKKLIDKRWRKTNLISWLLQITPFIRFIGICGSMSFGNVRENSDIDVFIISKNKRIWICFAISRLILKMTGQLRSNNINRAGKVCPNRYVTDKYLIINPQNAYLANQYSHMVPIFDEKDYYCKFLIANSWMENFGAAKPVCALNIVRSNSLNFFRYVLEAILYGSFGNWLEKYSGKLMLKKIAKVEPTLNQENSTVIANNNEIRIHPYHSK